MEPSLRHRHMITKEIYSVNIVKNICTACMCTHTKRNAPYIPNTKFFPQKKREWPYIHILIKSFMQCNNSPFPFIFIYKVQFRRDTVSGNILNQC